MEKTLQTISNLFSKTMITNNGNKWDSKLEICLKKFLLEGKVNNHINNENDYY